MVPLNWPFISKGQYQSVLIYANQLRSLDIYSTTPCGGPDPYLGKYLSRAAFLSIIFCECNTINVFKEKLPGSVPLYTFLTHANVTFIVQWLQNHCKHSFWRNINEALWCIEEAMEKTVFCIFFKFGDKSWLLSAWQKWSQYIPQMDGAALSWSHQASSTTG